jgi:hypothetical protein
MLRDSDTRNILYNVSGEMKEPVWRGSLLRRFECGIYPVSTLFTSPGVQGNEPIAQGRVLETEGASDRSSDLTEGPE